MPLFSDVAKAAELTAAATEVVNVVAQYVMPTTTAPVRVSLQFVDTQPNGQKIFNRTGFTLDVPNYTAEYGKMAINQTRATINMMELAIACQQVFDENGGIRYKDELDPYHYENVKRALEEQGEPVPPVANQPDTLVNRLGGEMLEEGILGNLSTILGALTTAETIGIDLPQLSSKIAGFFDIGSITDLPNPGPTGTEASSTVTGFFPDPARALLIMSSCAAIQAYIISYVTGLLRNATDTESKALVLKNVLGEWSKAVTDQTLQATGQQPPDWEEPTGQSGLRS